MTGRTRTPEMRELGIFVEQLEIEAGAGAGGRGQPLASVEYGALRVAAQLAPHLGAHIGLIRRLERHNAVLN